MGGPEYSTGKYLEVKYDNEQEGILDGTRGVGSAHSTRRTGEPATGGRGRNIYAAGKGKVACVVHDMRNFSG